MIYFFVKFQKDPLYGVNLTFFASWLPWKRPPFWICSTPPPQKSCHTLRWIFLQSFMKFDKRNPNCFKSLLFCFHDNCGKVCPTDSVFFGLSHSTRCGCCSYQVSLISVRRVTCYDHFFVFQFFSILAVSMATAAILNKLTPKGTTSHGIWYSYKVS